MAHFGEGVEQALHYLFRLGGAEPRSATSARDAAEFYRMSPASAAKLFTRLEKAGIVRASEGREGGFTLARPLAEISVLAVVDAVEGRKPLFNCKDIRTRCSVFAGTPPAWASQGVCAIHAAMIEAEQAMRQRLASTTLQDIRERAMQTIPAEFGLTAGEWFADRRKQRRKRRGQTSSQEI